MEKYLGDGVYAKFDFGLSRIILIADDNKIYIESIVFENLLNFFEKISNKKVTITEK